MPNLILHFIPFLAPAFFYLIPAAPLLSQALLTILLLFHATLLRGASFATIFWVGGIIFAYLHEYAAMNYTILYTNTTLLKLPGGPPLFFLFFWTNLIYTLASISEYIAQRHLFSGKVSARPFLIFLALITLSSLALEPLLLNNSLVIRSHLQLENKSLLAPLLIGADYCLYGFFLLAEMRSVAGGPWPLQQKLLGLMVVTPLLILFHTILLLPARLLF